MCDSDFGGAATGDESALFHQTSNHTESVVQGALGFVEDECISTTADYGDGRDGSVFMRHARDFDGARAERLNFVDKFC